MGQMERLPLPCPDERCRQLFQTSFFKGLKASHEPVQVMRRQAARASCSHGRALHPKAREVYRAPKPEGLKTRDLESR